MGACMKQGKGTTRRSAAQWAEEVVKNPMPGPSIAARFLPLKKGTYAAHATLRDDGGAVSHTATPVEVALVPGHTLRRRDDVDGEGNATTAWPAIMRTPSLLLVLSLAACADDPLTLAQPTTEPLTEAMAGGHDAAPTPVPAAPSAKATPPPPTTPAPCPPDMARLGRVCVDRYEAHLRVLEPHGDGTLRVGAVHPHNQRPDAGARYLAVSAPDVYPQGYISRDEAKQACAQAEKRLCSRGEWMLACRGTPALPGRDGARPCNNGKPHLLTLLHGGGYDYDEHFNNPALNLTPGFLAKTGAYPDCASDVGAHDLVGNLHEWVSDTVTSSFLRAFEAEGVGRQFQYVQVGNAVFMGGFYSTRGELGPGCMFTTVAHDAGYHDYSTGFRCCRDALDPAP